MAYNYLFCHSFSKGMAEVGNIHSNLSVNTDNKLVDISIKNEYHMNEFIQSYGIVLYHVDG